MKAENSSGTAWAAHGNLGQGFSCASNLNRISVDLPHPNLTRDDRHRISEAKMDPRKLCMTLPACEPIRCPDCGKRLFDLKQAEGSSFSLLIVCRCRQRFRVELPNPETGEKNSPLVRA